MSDGLTLDAIRPCLEGAIPASSRPAPPTARPTSPTCRRSSTSTPATWRCRSSSSTRRGRTSWPTRASTLLVIHPLDGAIYRLARALPAHRDRRPAVRAHEGQARRHRLAHRHERRVPAARHRRLRGRPASSAVAPPDVGRAAPAARIRLSVLRRCTERLRAVRRPRRRCSRRRWTCCESELGVSHAMLLMLDAAGAAPVHGGQPRLRRLGRGLGDPARRGRDRRRGARCARRSASTT